MKLRSGSRCSVSGVGTHRMTTSCSDEMREVGGGAESLLARGLNLFLRNAKDVGPTRFQIGYLLLVDIKACHLEAGAAQQKRERQTYIAKTNDTDLGGVSLQALQAFPSDIRQGERFVFRHKKNYCILPGGGILVFEPVVLLSENGW